MDGPGFSPAPSIFTPDDRRCLDPGVQRAVATFGLIVGIVGGSLSAITAPRLCALSDRVGRKPIMLVASCGGLVGEVITILAANFPDTVPYQWLIL